MKDFHYSQPYIVVGAVIERNGKLLLIQENQLPDKGKWNIPAGKLDFGEDPIRGVKREVFEETGLHFRPLSVLALHSIHRKDVPGPNHHTHVLRIVFVGKATGEVSLDFSDHDDGSPEIADHKWLTPDEVFAMETKLIRYHDTKRLIEDYVAGRTYPLELITHLIQEPQV